MEESIRGKWMNTITGETVIASSIINDGDQAMVMTNNGIIPMTEFTNYVQIGEEEINPASVGVNMKTNINDYIINSPDKSLLNEIVKPSTEREINQPKPTETQKESKNFWLIDKLFTKFGGIKVNVSIDWLDFPIEQLNVLIQIYEVPKSEIADYISKHFASLDNVSKEIENTL